MTEILSGSVQVAANGWESQLFFTCPKGEEIEILATGYLIPSSGYIEERFKERIVGKAIYNVAPDENHMVPRSVKMVAGDSWSAIGYDTSAAPNIMGVCVVIDRTILTS